MASQEDIDHQVRLLRIHRANARHFQNQIRLLGVLSPQGITNGIVEERRAINRIITLLRGWGQSIDDAPEDVRNEYETNLGIES